MTDLDARDHLFVHTVEQEVQQLSNKLGDPGWPAVMCRHCGDRMAAEGHTTYVDHTFSFNPSCPQRRGYRVCEIFYGMPADHETVRSWEYTGECCVEPENWWCGICLTSW